MCIKLEEEHIKLEEENNFNEKSCNILNIFRCAICEKQFSTKNSLKVHTESHRKDKPYRCPTCLKCFKTCGYLQKHIQKHDPNRIKFQCEMCPTSFKFKGTLIKHIKRHKNEYDVKCEHCNMKFVSVGERNNHISQKHHGGLLCPVCGKRYKAKDAFTRHIEQHERDYEKEEHHSLPQIPKCKYCGKLFSKMTYMRRHLTRCDQNEDKQSIVCDICGKAFTKENLRKHILVHQGAKPLECNICHKRFLQHYTLKMHRYTHNKEKKFKCNFCNQSYTQYAGLKSHEKRIHLTREKIHI